jgi:hypothetical protein
MLGELWTCCQTRPLAQLGRCERELDQSGPGTFHDAAAGRPARKAKGPRLGSVGCSAGYRGSGSGEPLRRRRQIGPAPAAAAAANDHLAPADLHGDRGGGGSSSARTWPGSSGASLLAIALTH